jgi:2-keto-4-pentenoate hydratase/2-oxohepta-3-ene-1,7-dioic acid hydratase in catechol pathway
MGDNNIKMSFQSNATKYFPKILCVGKNYLKHVKEMGGTELPTTPLIFTKPWSTLAFNPKLLSLPSTKVHQIDHELELGVYINKAGKNIHKE